MAPRPTILGDNRFSPFLDEPNKSPTPKKKKRTHTTTTLDEAFPDLPTSTGKADPKYLTVVSADAAKPLSSFSCFAIHRALKLINKDIETISSLKDGSLLLLVKSLEIANKFINAKNLCGLCPIKCSLHEKLNITKGTVYAPYLINVPDEEIVSELSSQGVVSVYKFSRTIDGEKRFTGSILLDFNKFSLPSKINISWYTVKVKEYMPNPMRCRNCQLLGHTSKRCNNNPSCVTCNLPPHSPAECTRTMCANCFEDHPSSSPNCKMFKMQKEILTIKTRNKCSMAQARQVYRSLFPTNSNTNTITYADIASSANNLTLTSNVKAASTQQQNSLTNTDNNLITPTKSKILYNKTQNNRTTLTTTNNNTNNQKNNISTKAYNINEHEPSAAADNSYDIGKVNTTKNNNNKIEIVTTTNTPNLNSNNKTLDLNEINTNSKPVLNTQTTTEIQQYKNNSFFIPLNSRDSVLAKSQLSRKNSGDSE